MACDCTISLDLIPLGGTGCGLEYTNGSIYSIGTQTVAYANLYDPCNCFVNLLINGMNVPACVIDGEELFITIVIKSDCNLCTSSSACRNLSFLRINRNFLKKTNLMTSIRKRKLSLKKPSS